MNVTLNTFHIQLAIDAIAKLPGIEAADAVKIATVAVAKLNDCVANQNPIYIREDKEICPRALIVNPKSCSFIVLFKKHVDFQKKGTWNKVTLAQEIIFKEDAVTVLPRTRRVNKKKCTHLKR